MDRSGGLTTALIVHGYLEPTEADLRAITGTEQKLRITELVSIRPITPEEFDLILQSIQR